MKSTITAAVLATLIFGLSGFANARDAVPQTTQQVLSLKDGSTLYVFKDGKMAKEDKFGRAVYLKEGERMETADGRTMTAVGNEVARLHLLLAGHQG